MLATQLPVMRGFCSGTCRRQDKSIPKNFASIYTYHPEKENLHTWSDTTAPFSSRRRPSPSSPYPSKSCHILYPPRRPVSNLLRYRGNLSNSHAKIPAESLSETSSICSGWPSLWSAPKLPLPPELLTTHRLGVAQLVVASQARGSPAPPQSYLSLHTSGGRETSDSFHDG